MQSFDTRMDTQSVQCRLLIFASDALVRDACAKIADSLDYVLYSSAYIDNFESVVRHFKPTRLVIDVGLLNTGDMEVLGLAAADLPNVKILFLAAEDASFPKSAEALAQSMGLDVEGSLTRPIDEAALQVALGSPA